MEPAIKVAIGALTIAFFSLIVTAINSVFTAKTYEKNRRLEFLQRKDHLSQKISDLNDRNNEAQLISARYQLVAVNATGLALQGEQAERNTALIASYKEQREGVEKVIKLWDENIEKLHFIYSNLTLETDASEVEKLIAAVQVSSDSLKKLYSGYSSTLYLLETNNEFIKVSIAERDEKIRQIDQEFQRKVEKLNLDFERKMEKLEKK
jgi:type II secretory pathway component PulJ